MGDFVWGPEAAGEIAARGFAAQARKYRCVAEALSDNYFDIPEVRASLGLNEIRPHGRMNGAPRPESESDTTEAEADAP